MNDPIDSSRLDLRINWIYFYTIITIDEAIKWGLIDQFV